MHIIPDGWLEPDAQLARTRAWYEEHREEVEAEVQARLQERRAAQGDS